MSGDTTGNEKAMSEGATSESSTSDAILEPREADLEAFWTHAVIAGNLYPASAYAGQDDITALRPAAFAFGSSREEADRLAQLVVDRKKTATSGFASDYTAENVPFPEKGDMAIVADGRGIPRALIRDVRVVFTPFDEVGDEIALAEGEGDIAQWRAIHESFFFEHVPGFEQDAPSGADASDAQTDANACEEHECADVPGACELPGIADAREYADVPEPRMVVTEFFEVLYAK